MLKQLVLILVVVSVSLGQKISKKSYTGTKAASPFTNYGCQCSNLQFVAKGYRQGNCASADETGALWCYVDNNHNSCQDKRRSDRYHNRAWSYEACATPSIYGGNYQNQPVCKGSRCGGYGTGSNFGNNGGYGTGSNFGNNGGYGTGSNFGNNGGYGGNTGGCARGTKCYNNGNGYGTGGSLASILGGGGFSGSNGGYGGSNGGFGGSGRGSTNNRKASTEQKVNFGR